MSHKVMIVVDVEKMAHYKDIIEILGDTFSKRGFSVLKLYLKKSELDRQLVGKMNEENPHIICSLDMSGFGVSTLTETYFYNICVAKQMHILVDEQVWKDYNLDYALNQFFYFPKGNGTCVCNNLFINAREYDKENLESYQKMIDTFLQEIGYAMGE